MYVAANLNSPPIHYGYLECASLYCDHTTLNIHSDFFLPVRDDASMILNAYTAPAPNFRQRYIADRLYWNR